MRALSVGNAWRDQPARTMAFMGLVSGILSATVGFEHEWSALAPVASLVFLDAGTLPIGLFFAIVIALGMLAGWARRGPRCWFCRDHVRLERRHPHGHQTAAQPR